MFSGVVYVYIQPLTLVSMNELAISELATSASYKEDVVSSILDTHGKYS